MKLSTEERNQKLKGLEGWSFEDNSIEKTFEFDNFLIAMNFVNNVAVMAQEENHHPDIKISYNKVTMTLSTHDEGGVTEKDINLAGRINSLI